ncbi:MAG: Hpt domain-containing protein [Oscillospiraceae bacterium]|nr:Hpt domain-containing protein [Oscillospiraceae bacterium]
MANYIDEETGLGRLQGNKGLYKRMLNLFVSSKEPAAFEEALADNNNEQASAVMHSIKGIAGNLALTSLFEISSVLMTELKDGIVNTDLIEQYRESLKNTTAAAEELMARLG